MRSIKEKAELCRALHAGAEPCQSARNFDPPYCLRKECYPGGAVGVDTDDR